MCVCQFFLPELESSMDATGDARPAPGWLVWRRQVLHAWLWGCFSCLFAKESADEVISPSAEGCSPQGSHSSWSPGHTKQDIACQGITLLQVSPCLLMLWGGLSAAWTGCCGALGLHAPTSPSPPALPCSLEAICSLQSLTEGPNPQKCKRWVPKRNAAVALGVVGGLGSRVGSGVPGWGEPCPSRGCFGAPSPVRSWVKPRGGGRGRGGRAGRSVPGSKQGELRACAAAAAAPVPAPRGASGEGGGGCPAERPRTAASGASAAVPFSPGA